jgi:two-component system nitrogen regulation response regulator GlnG
MPGMSGLELLARLRERAPDLPVIIMTAHSDLDSAVSAYQGGAFEYLPKPFDVDEAVALVRRACQMHRQQIEPQPQIERLPDIVGEGPAMQEVFRAIGRLSHSNITVLITGESGTGKELVARALHRHSPRADKPFIAINTAAIPRDLLESELFGHERGAFTGAQSRARDGSSRPIPAPCFWTRSATCPPNCRPACCECWPRASFIGWAAICRPGWMCG